jgi:uncharacterized protein (DUF2236 family)
VTSAPSRDRPAPPTRPSSPAEPAAHTPVLGEPLGPDSLTWRTLGDWRLALVGMRAGVLQTMHPAIEKGVRDHSDYFKGPFDRIWRSVPQIVGVVYDADRLGVAAQVRDYHRPIKGELDTGERYHALDPETYYWAHATFFEAQVAAMQFFGREPSEEDKERLYQESVQWYSLYGMSMRPVPPDYAAFCDYWDRTCAEVLEHNRFSRGTFKKRRGAFGPSPSRLIPGPVWRVVSDAAYDAGVWMIRGTLPPELRERMGLEWTAADERRLRRIGFLTRHTIGRLPLRWRLAPQATSAYRREGVRPPGW